MLTEIEEQRLLLLKYRELAANTRLKIRKLALAPCVINAVAIWQRRREAIADCCIQCIRSFPHWSGLIGQHLELTKKLSDAGRVAPQNRNPTIATTKGGSS